MGLLVNGFCQTRGFSLVKLREKSINEKRIYDLVESSQDIVYYFDVVEYQFKYLSPSLDSYFGAGHLEQCMEDSLLAFRNLHPDDVHIMNDKMSGNIDYSKPILQRWRGVDGNYQLFEEYASPIYKDGELVAVQGIIRLQGESSPTTGT